MKIENVRYDVMGAGHDAYAELLKILGRCVPEVAGWCELTVEGFVRTAIVVTQAWPRALPLGTDPQPILKAKKYAALIPTTEGVFQVVEVPGPEQQR